MEIAEDCPVFLGVQEEKEKGDDCWVKGSSDKTEGKKRASGPDNYEKKGGGRGLK